MSAIKPLVLTARAKINLALHVTGQRDDGYHLLDTLVTFCDYGDRLNLSFGNHKQDEIKLTIDGPECEGLSANSENLVVRSIEAYRACAVDKGIRVPTGISVLLNKKLPVSSGIGGGSADAAASLLGVNQLCGSPLGLEQLCRIGETIGADVPMCVLEKPCRATGIGENIATIPLPQLELVLVNPRVGLSTPTVFSSLTNKTNPSLPYISEFGTVDNFVSWLKTTRNDLFIPALSMAPDIAKAMKSLDEMSDCLYHGMSGSGATCFGIFRDKQAAELAAGGIKAKNIDWWVKATATFNG